MFLAIISQKGQIKLGVSPRFSLFSLFVHNAQLSLHGILNDPELTVFRVYVRAIRSELDSSWLKLDRIWTAHG